MSGIRTVSQKAMGLWISILESGKESVKRGIAVPFENDFDLKCTSDIIKKSSLHFRRYFHFSSVEKVLDSLIDDFYNFKLFLSENNRNRLILLGNPGSGKTTGIVSEARDEEIVSGYRCNECGAMK